jgi:Ca2+-binding EF-hand superfamily protein
VQLNGEEIKELIQVLDIDGDGEISIDEFMVVVNAPE